MAQWVDLHVEAPGAVARAAEELPPGAAGAVLFGPSAERFAAELSARHPGLLWRHAAIIPPLSSGAQGAAPPPSAHVAHLSLDAAAPGGSRDLESLRSLLSWLQQPPRRLIRLALPPGTRTVARVKHLVRRFPQARFLLDPFVHGPLEGWQAHVRLAENANVWLSTLGLDPFAATSWSEAAAEEALDFLVGEVGSAKLLYASGDSWPDWQLDRRRRFRDWLGTRKSLDPREAEMVLWQSASGLLA